MNQQMRQLLTDITNPDRWVFVWLGCEQCCPIWLRYLIGQFPYTSTAVSGTDGERMMGAICFDAADIGALEIAAAIVLFKANGVIDIRRWADWIGRQNAFSWISVSHSCVNDKQTVQEFHGFHLQLKRTLRRFDTRQN